MAGRKTLYKPEYDKQVYKFCLLGATDKQIGDFFEVCEDTIHNWKKEYPSFFESIKKGKIVADAEIAHALYHRAKGYKHKETKFFSSDGLITDEVEVDKHYPPDTAAAFIWLKNRAGWRDKSEVEIEGTQPIFKVFDAREKKD